MHFQIDSRLTDLIYNSASFKDIGEGIIGRVLWTWLQRSDNVIRMETASYLERSAIEPLGLYLLLEFGEDVAEDRCKQMIGHMTRQIMEKLGYELVQKSMTISKGMFSTGARYQRADEKRDRSMRITKEQRESWLTKTANTPFNIWLKKEVVDENGKLDLNRLYAIAAKYGITDIERYKSLNPGQQRMTIGNRLRSIVPPTVYENEIYS